MRQNIFHIVACKPMYNKDKLNCFWHEIAQRRLDFAIKRDNDRDRRFPKEHTAFKAKTLRNFVKLSNFKCDLKAQTRQIRRVCNECTLRFRFAIFKF